MRQLDPQISEDRDHAARNSQLQSSQTLINLQYELIGTENRIAVERMRYNQTIHNYNQKVRLFPNSLLASAFGFSAKPYLSSPKN